MITKIFTLLILLGSINLYSQEFEGIIIYNVKVEFSGIESDSSLMDALNTFQSTQTEYFKEDYHKSISSTPIPGLVAISQFDPKSKLTYAYTQGNLNEAYWYDASKHVSHNFSVTEIEEERILEYDCKGLKFQSEEIEVIYRYSDNHKIDVNRYRDNQSYYFSEFIKRTGSLPLKYSVKVAEGQYNVLTAIEIQEKVLIKEEFEIPKFDILIESEN